MNGTHIAYKKCRCVDFLFITIQIVCHRTKISCFSPLLTDNFNSCMLVENHKKGDEKMGNGRKYKTRPLSIKEKVYGFAIKCYDEQLPYGIETTIKALQAMDKSLFQILLICHYRDEVSDGVWEVALEKRHYHILFRYIKPKQRVRIYQILNYLHIYFRPGIDDILLENRAIETIGNFQHYCMYLTHETKDAINDNKELYSIEEIVSNLSVDEIKAIRDGYIRVADAPTKPSMSKLTELDEEAFKLGYELKNFSNWYNALPFNIRSNSKMKTIEASYQRGVDKRIEENQEVNRLCIFIMGTHNTGKTYAAKKALDGKKYLCIGGGGTGKFDKLRADHEAIIIDDDVCGNLLNLTDNYICRAYKRNNGNPPWTGKYFIATSNMSFSEWIQQCGIKIYDRRGMPSSHYKAMLSRFYICVLVPDNKGKNKLACINVSTRGTKKDQEERKSMFEDFRQKFDLTMAEYTPSDDEVDYSSVLNIEEAGCLAVEAK